MKVFKVLLASGALYLCFVSADASLARIATAVEQNVPELVIASIYGHGRQVVQRYERMAVPRAGEGHQNDSALKGIDFAIDKSWKDDPIDHDPFSFHMEWFFERQDDKPQKPVVKISCQGRFFDDPPPPKEPSTGGYCANLWDYECVELFFANDKEQYLEVEIGPHGHWLVYLLNGRRKPFNKGEKLDLKVQNTFEGSNWRCLAEIPLVYFPPNVTKFNAYAIHGSGDKRHYEALYPVSNGSEQKPDFHRLQYFEPIQIERIIPQGFNDRPFNDSLYGDLWSNVGQQQEPA